ncbi:MAG: hypothetical protein ACXWJ4_08335 [Methyloceanibacter sp.]
MARGEFSLSGICGRRLLSAAVAIGMLAATASAQTVIEPPRLPNGPGTSGVGGGAGLIPPMPEFPAARSLTPTLPPPVAAPLPAAPPVAVPAAPAEAAREVRFTCEVAPDAESCREAGAPDGGGDDSECSCARDVCYDHLDPSTGKSHRVCEKAK